MRYLDLLKSLADRYPHVLRRSVTVVGILLGSFFAAAILIPQIPGLPYNVREVFDYPSPLTSALLLTGTLLSLALPPVLIAHWLVLKPEIGVWVLLPWVSLQGVLSWLFLRKAVPAESLHDILGSPILGWSGDWELLLRFLGLMAAPALIATAMAIIVRPSGRRRRGLAALFPTLLIAAPLWHYTVVIQAATDNITELLAGGGDWIASLGLGVWFAVLSVAGSYVSKSTVAQGGRHRMLSAVGVAVASIPIGYVLVLWATEAHVYKYGQTFTALQFLLSPNRDQLISGSLLFGSYALAHTSAVMIGALAQYLAWYAIFSSSKPTAVITVQSSQNGPRLAWRLAWVYIALLVYGTLFPWWEWQSAHPGDLKNLWTWPNHVSPADVLTNLIVYLPLGILLGLASRKTIILKLLLVAIAGLLLSVTLESLQIFVPNRTTSGLDVLLNTAGCAGGALLAVLAGGAGPRALQWRTWRSASFHPGQTADVGLMAVGIWLLAAASPLVPSFDFGNLRQGIAPLWNTLAGRSPFDLGACIAYGFSIAALGLLLRSLTRPRRLAIPMFIIAATAATLAAVPLINRALTLEMVTGLVGGIIAALLPRRNSAITVASIVILAYAVQQLQPVSGLELHTGFNWLPFRFHLNHPELLLQSLEKVWPFVALAYLAAVTYPTNTRAVIPSGVVLVIMVAGGIEWGQMTIPGRYPDVTDVIMALSGWLLPWFYLGSGSTSLPESESSDALQPDRPRVSTRTPWLVASVATLLVAGGVILADSFLIRNSTTNRFFDKNYPKPPPPESLPIVNLPAFRVTHPRLPAPSVADLAVLQRDGRGFLKMHQRFAQQKRGKLDSRILTAYVNPGKVDLAILHTELMALKFSGRGSVEAKPLALAYDWLYSQWTETQRQALRDKLVEAGHYLIGLIREDRLSAYNVYLYNSPLQALMAVSLALYQDDPRGEPIMRFTYDLWKNRVLPVWRQIMGQNGGWHEGGEYVGLGIGQAVYQLPALWREATGENLFLTEPGLRGFLDFLVYRTRPDGTHFRWGDAGFFDRDVPDRLPLAIEYGHAAAYTLNKPPKRLVPTAWPWGPLSDERLRDSTASARLPWAKLFDGLGLVVARSDWSSQATYVTFKAGDNYWSHSHLDQGAFTLYRGGALAIDSGLYGPDYGADHHMNYTYQSIAHNIVTVTDPEDTAPAPPLKKDDPPRSIANDGGQRRIGSGWGLGQAPVDLAEWQAEREIYHTGKIEKSVIRDDLLVMAADVTPAYTHRFSGPGEFSHRTRRVERFWRTFIYDRVDDVVIVFDQVTATRADFLKRWLLHSQNVPRITGNRFELEIPALDRAGRQGGRLTGYMLLPRAVHLQAIGGPGFEFFVDGRNYDEGGAVAELHARKPDTEPGAWRIEAIPVNDALEHHFLAVLLPTDWGTSPVHRVRLIEEEGRIGVEVSGPRRTTRWRFEPGTIVGQVRILPVGPGGGDEEVLIW